MTNESAKAYIALAVEVEEVRQEVAHAERRLAQDPTDQEAADELAEGRALLKRLELAAGFFMGLLKEKHVPRAAAPATAPATATERPLHQSADLA